MAFFLEYCEHAVSQGSGCWRLGISVQASLMAQDAARIECEMSVNNTRMQPMTITVYTSTTQTGIGIVQIET